MAHHYILTIRGKPLAHAKVLERRHDDIEAEIFFDGTLGPDGRTVVDLPVRYVVLIGPTETQPVEFGEGETEKSADLV